MRSELACDVHCLAETVLTVRVRHLLPLLNTLQPRPIANGEASHSKDSTTDIFEGAHVGACLIPGYFSE